MARKEQLDKLSLDMIECEKAGYGVHYGAWKATQKPVKIEPKGVPVNAKTCPECGAYIFHPKVNQIYCCFDCQRRGADRRMRGKRNEYKREWRNKKRAEAIE